MARYFSRFPKTPYSFDETVSVNFITNIVSRFSIENKIKENTAAYYTYDINDGDTPEILAHKIYGSIEKHWVILLMNDIIDPQFDWPLRPDQFQKYIIEKYGSLQAARDATHSYYKTEKITFPDNTVSVQTFRISKEEFEAEEPELASGLEFTIIVEKFSKSVMQYETEENEKKRRIKILKPAFVPAIEEEFQAVFNR